MALLAFAVHSGTLGNELTFDDHAAVERNPLTEKPWDLAVHFSSGFWGEEYELTIATWRPLATLTLAWNRALHGTHPLGFHLVNLLLHSLTCVVVCLLARRWDLPAPAALGAGALFAVMPVHVEAIAAAVGRADLLLGLAGLGTLLLWERGQTAWATIALACALLSKEMAVTLVPLLLWIDVVRGRGWKRWLVPAALVPVWLGLRYAALGTLAGPTPGFLENPLVGADIWTRLWTAGEIYWKSLGLLTTPGALLHDYSFATVEPASGATVAGISGLLLLAATAAGAVALARRAPVVSLSLALFILPYLLVSHLGPTLPMIFAERVFYLPSAGLCILALHGAAAATPRLKRPWLPTVCLALLMLFFAGRCALRVTDWKDDATLFLTDIEHAPRGVKPLTNAAAVLARQGRIDEALLLARRAVEVRPESSMGHISVANLAIVIGNRDEALTSLEAASRLSPGVASFALARCAFEARFNGPDAVKACRQAVNAPLSKPYARVLLGTALDLAGNPSEAERSFKTALSLDPHPTVDFYYNYAIFLARNRRYAEALPLLEEAAGLAPARTDIARALTGARKLNAKQSPNVP